jgi:hypothetical protein
MAYIPDFAERQIFKTLYSLVLCIIDEMTSDLKLNVIGDQIVFKLEPHFISAPSLVDIANAHVSNTTGTSTCSATEATSTESAERRVGNCTQSLREEEVRLQEALQLVRARRRELETVMRENEGTSTTGTLPGMASIADAFAELDEMLERKGINTQELLTKYSSSRYMPAAQIAIGFAAGACSVILLNAIFHKKNV